LRRRGRPGGVGDRDYTFAALQLQPAPDFPGGKTRMKRAFVTSSILAAALALSACGSHHDLHRSDTQDNFGVQMARTNLWREAQFRFQRAVELNPQNAMAHNNLAVALEANGDFEKARREYLEALKLDKGNQFIQKNYSRFTEFLQKNKKRQQRN